MEIERTIREILVVDLFAEMPEEAIDPDDSLRDVIGLDSLGFTELRVQCENRFGATISDDDFTAENFASIRTVSALVRRLREAGTASVDNH